MQLVTIIETKDKFYCLKCKKFTNLGFLCTNEYDEIVFVEKCLSCRNLSNDYSVVTTSFFVRQTKHLSCKTFILNNIHSHFSRETLSNWLNE